MPSRPKNPLAAAPDLVDVVFVGQLPPPRHGQSLANLAMVEGKYERIRISAVPMRFSDDLGAVGRFSVGKLLRIPGLIWAVIGQWRAGKRDVLVYTVGAKNRVGIARDLLVLPWIRPLYRRTVFFVHTGGMRPLYDRPGLRLLARLGYGRADAAIHLDPSVAGPDDLLPQPKQVVYLHHGLTDPVATGALDAAQLERSGRSGATPVILFVGNLYPEKGTHVLVRAGGLLAEQGHRFEIRFVGVPPTDTAAAELLELARTHGIADRVELLGSLDRADVWAQLAAADIFSFPSHYEAEAWPLVALEAMAAALPVVTTRWRARPAMVDDGVTGYLVDPGDDAALAERLARLVSDPDRTRTQGRAGRARFVAEFGIDTFDAGFERIVLDAVGVPAR